MRMLVTIAVELIHTKRSAVAYDLGSAGFNELQIRP